MTGGRLCQGVTRRRKRAVISLCGVAVELSSSPRTSAPYKPSEIAGIVKCQQNIFHGPKDRDGKI